MASNDVAPVDPGRGKSNRGRWWKAVRSCFEDRSYAPAWLPHFLQQWYVSYLIALLLQVGLFAFISFLSGGLPLIRFVEVPMIIVVLVVALGWGLGPGLLATLIGSAFLWVIYRYEPSTVLPSVLENMLGILLFAVCGMGITLIASQVQQARQHILGAWRETEQARRRAEILLRELEMERVQLSETVASESQLRSVAENAKRQLETVLDVLPVGVGIADTSGRVVMCNSAFRHTWGIAPVDIDVTDVPYKGWWAANGELLSPTDWRELRMAAKDGVGSGKEIDIEAFGAQRKTVLYFAAPIRDEREMVTGSVSVLLDITRRKHLEQQTRDALQALLVLAEELVALPAMSSDDQDERQTLDASSLGATAHRLVELIRSLLACKRVGMMTVDFSGHEWRSLAVVGLSPEQEQNWHEHHSGVYLHDLLSFRAIEARLNQGQVVKLDMRRPRPPFAAYTSPYGAKTLLLAPMRVGQRLIGILLMDHEYEPHEYSEHELALAKAAADLAALILERERLLEERAESQASMLALQETNHLKDEFIGIAGHELRTPLTTIKASVQLARRQLSRIMQQNEDFSEDVFQSLMIIQSLLDRAERQVGMQSRLVSDLLDISRIEAGRLVLHPVLHDLLSLVREVVEDQQALVPDRVIELKVPEVDEVMVLADEDRLRQVISNYLSNALKYSDAERPVRVSVEAAGAQVRVSVQDEGPGLSETEQQMAWKRFYRVPGIEVRSGSGVGLGLGLHISRMIIERQGGKVGVNSVKDHGSTFWLSLRCAEESPG